MSSGKVYAVHLFVLVSSVKILLTTSKNPKTINIQHWSKSTNRSAEQQMRREQKKYITRWGKYYEKLLHYLLCIPQKSQLNKMFKNFIFLVLCSCCLSISGCAVAMFVHSFVRSFIRPFKISTRIDFVWTNSRFLTICLFFFS